MIIDLWSIIGRRRRHVERRKTRRGRRHQEIRRDLAALADVTASFYTRRVYTEKGKVIYSRQSLCIPAIH